MGFSADRVASGIKRLQEAQLKKSQQRMDRYKAHVYVYVYYLLVAYIYVLYCVVCNAYTSAYMLCILVASHALAPLSYTLHIYSII